jgi:hypothetical protein
MATTKRIVCLANSRKLNGRCVAGREVIDGRPGDWVRPVSDREHQEVSEYERQYEDGSDPSVLDVIDIPLRGPVPGTYQQENWLLDPAYYWARRGEFPWEDLGAFTTDWSTLWLNGDSTYHGVNDQIPIHDADSLDTSLTLIYVSGVELNVFAPGEAFGNSKRRVQARFSYQGVEYRLWVTDPIYEREYLALPNGRHELGEAFLTISLGEPFRDHCNKLVAAIIEPTGAGSRA